MPNKYEKYYRILDLHVGTSKENVKKAFRELSHIWHPDNHMGKSSNVQNRATEKFKEISNAYQVLKEHLRTEDKKRNEQDQREREEKENKYWEEQAQKKHEEEKCKQRNEEHIRDFRWGRVLLGVVFFGFVLMFLFLGLFSSDKEGIRSLKPLAEQGHAYAQYHLGRMYKYGQGVPQDYKEAVKWYRLSAEQGDASAQYNLGVMYEDGQGVPRDYKEAVRLYLLSAEQGNITAQYHLGRMYKYGHGVPQDYKEAVKWYRLSAEQGHAYAQFILGVMYEKGRGVLQDYVLAHMWWNISGSNGNKDATENRDIVETKMTPQQIEKAEEMARYWKPTKK
jgi:uncharacterized protein